MGCRMAVPACLRMAVAGMAGGRYSVTLSDPDTLFLESAARFASGLSLSPGLHWGPLDSPTEPENVREGTAGGREDCFQDGEDLPGLRPRYRLQVGRGERVARTMLGHVLTGKGEHLDP